MFKKFFRLFYFAKWYLECKFFGRKKPLQSVVFISDKCNLACKHCCIESKNISKTFEQIKEELEYCYNLGSRFVDFEGGEPFLWHTPAEPAFNLSNHFDDAPLVLELPQKPFCDKNINDLIELAKKIGFFSTTVTTNAQLPIECDADLIWVSLDGLSQIHDSIRGEGVFEKLIKNINNSTHKNINANMTINNLNYENVGAVIEFVAAHPKIRLLSLNFHTPFGDNHDLMLTPEKRNEIIDLIIDYKKRGYPIMNTICGLKLMKNPGYNENCYVTNFIMPDGLRLPQCQGFEQNLCESCGLAMSGEMKCLLDFRLETIFAGLKVRN